MKLIAAVLGWVLKRLLSVVVIVLVLFGGYLLFNWASEEFTAAMNTKQQLAQAQSKRATAEAELQATQNKQADYIEALKAQTLNELIETSGQMVDKAEQELKKKRSEIENLVPNPCNGFVKFVQNAGGIFGLPKPCAEAENAYIHAKGELKSLEDDWKRAENQLNILKDRDLTTDEKLEKVGSNLGEFGDPVLKSEIADHEQTVETLKADEESLKQKQNPWIWLVIDQWNARWMWFVGTALVILLALPLTRVFNYFIAMPLVTRAAKPVRLSIGENASHGQIVVGPTERSLAITLAPGDVLNARAQHVRDVQGTVKPRLLYSYKAPFLSFAAGLSGLSRVTSDDGVSNMTISDPEESDSYMVRIDFLDHPGLVIRPKHLVGILGTPKIETRWRLGWHFLATGRARYILFSGSGSLLVQGISDIVARVPHAEKSKMEQNLVMGFDSRLTVSVARTENFISYLFGKEPLVNEVFNGPYPYFWQKTATDGTKNAIEKMFDTFFSAIGKIFGF